MIRPPADAAALLRSLRTLRAQRVELAQLSAEAGHHVGAVSDVTHRMPGTDVVLAGLLEEYEQGCRVMTRGLDGLIRHMHALMARTGTAQPHAPATRSPGPDGVPAAGRPADPAAGRGERW